LAFGHAFLVKAVVSCHLDKEAEAEELKNVCFLSHCGMKKSM